MDYLHEKITAIGKRLKQEAKERNLTNQDIADLIGYSCGKQISPIYSGKKTISKEQAERLASAWHIRVEYLLCSDDWKTESEMLEQSKTIDISNFQISRMYLESLGIVLKPHIHTILEVGAIYRNWDRIKDYLTSDSLLRLQERYDFSLKPKEFKEKYVVDKVDSFDWRKPITDIGFDFTNVGKNTFCLYGKLIDEANDHPQELNLKAYEYLQYTVYFSMYKDGKHIRDISVFNLQRLMRIIDSLTLNTIDTLFHEKCLLDSL